MRAEVATGDVHWRQLTYTSSDEGLGSRGGWGIKQESSGMDAEARTVLERGFATLLEEVVETPAFASEEVLELRPRRMVFREPTAGILCLWHAATAGHDATGRPGNVFNHAAARAGEFGHLRPIEYWRSPDWLSPFGPIAVNAARLPADLRVGTAVTRESVVDFIRQGERIEVLEWLLAALDHTIALDRPLLLSVPSPDEAALWMGALSYATSATHARQVGFVTFERRPGLERGESDDLCVVFLPPDELSPEDLEGEIYLDVTRRMDEGPDGSWVGQGRHFPASLMWQGCVLDVFGSGDRAEALLASIDEVCEGLLRDDVRGLPLEWPLQAALLSDPTFPIEDRAGRLVSCVSRAPGSVLANPRVARLLEEVSGDSSLRQLVMDGPDSSPAVLAELDDRAASTYLARTWAIADTVPFVSSVSGPGLAGLARTAVRDALDEADGQEQGLLRAARLLGFVIEHRLLIDSDSTTEDPIVDRACKQLGLRVNDPERGLSPEQRRLLDPRLSGAARPDHEQPATPPLSVLPARTVPVEASPWPLPDHVPTSSAASGAGSHPVLIEDKPIVGVHHPLDLVEQLLELLRSCDSDERERIDAIADALLVARGVFPVPLRRGENGVRDVARYAESLHTSMGDDDQRGALLRWLVVFYALGEAVRLDDGLPVDYVRPPEWLFPELIAAADVAMAGLEQFLLRARIDVAAAVFSTSAQRTVLNPTGSVLALKIGGEFPLGWTAVTAAWPSMRPERRGGILSAANDRIGVMAREQSSKIQILVDQLQASAAPDVRTSSAGSNKGGLWPQKGR